MNISDIITQSSAGGGRSTAFGTDSFLRIGKRGSVVDGVISIVSDQISIRFGEIGVSVPAGSVRNATEGETRRFQVMEVSREGIVLKELGTAETAGRAEPMVGTTVSTAGNSFADCLQESGKMAEATQLAGQNIAVLTGEDYQGLESEQGALEEYEASALDRAIARHKEHRAWQQENAEQNIERGQQFQETIKALQEQGVTALMSPEEIARSLREADLPVTRTTVARVASAVQMAEILPELSQNARVYLLENQMSPTIENLYHGQYSSAGAMDAATADAQVWAQLQGQIEQLLAEKGLDGDSAALGDAKWLFANDLPVTLENIRTLRTLDQIQYEMTPQKLMEQMVYAMQTGASPEQASLDERQLVIARQAIRGFAEIAPEDAVYAVREMGQQEVSLQTLRQAAEIRRNLYGDGSRPENGTADAGMLQKAGQQILNGTTIAGGQEASKDTQTASRIITVQRQLEEIRLKMTLQSAVQMERRGIQVETAPLQELVEELRTQEREYYRQITPGMVWDEETLTAAQETLDKAREVSEAPAQILGMGLRQQRLLTMNVLHGVAVSRTVQTEQYQRDYEKVGTQVRQDLGDSIQKAFQNIPELLRELGLEDTQENRRAVRILGYNGMALTREQINRAKCLDTQINTILSQMKPAVVLEMIREGADPMDLPLDVLEDRLRDISAQKDISSEERYSRFLWKLEQQQEISAQEREGYIGIYRLLHQIERSDGAAIGSVMETGREMTLRNLLTAVRTRRGHGIDETVDDAFGGLMDLQYAGKSITEQISAGFAGSRHSDAQSAFGQEMPGQVVAGAGSSGQEPTENENNTSDGESADAPREEMQRYYERLARQTLRSVSPEVLRQAGKDGLESILDQSLESFHAQATSGMETQDETDQQLYEQLARQLRESVEHGGDGIRYLQELGISGTISHIQAAERLIGQGYDVYAEIDKRKKQLSPSEQKALARAAAEIPESLEDAEKAQEGYDRLEGLMEQVLQSSYESTTITGEELSSLRQLGQGLVLQSSMVRRHSYDVPIETQDGMTAMNVTLIQGSGDSGKVEIFWGDLSAELRIRQGEVKGLLLCGNREMYDMLSRQGEALSGALEEQGFTVKDISCTMDRRSRVHASAGTSEAETPTQELYRAARTVVHHVMQCLRETESMEGNGQM